MLANILKQLGINETLWIQLGVFIALFIFLKVVFFGPFLRLIELREKETGGTEKDAAEINARAATQEAEYQSKISAAKKHSREAAEVILAKAKNDAAVRVAKAREESKTKIETGRAALDSEDTLNNKDLQSNVDGLASTIVAKLMKTKVEI
jgi:F0F1-type ATP synthase membrane subunit b/b'